MTDASKGRESRYETEQCELKYIPVPQPFVWNIFEKHRGKRVFNVPEDLAFCVDNPALVLQSDYQILESKLLAAEAKLAEHEKNGLLVYGRKIEVLNGTIAKLNEYLEAERDGKNKKFSENLALKDKLLEFEGMTFSENLETRKLRMEVEILRKQRNFWISNFWLEESSKKQAQCEDDEIAKAIDGLE